ncbi:preprotein translocase subunit SecE [Coxiella endosymbiont of Amblyomma sculptum]|uniref:preprotein translocase subunit SecE n=1 Tax=Coxiella endosymbiont of Amblyomma sculptum TaxID=2487929 RepID=UPI00132EE68F|nr:preprotein translocase subunit SecE [Coxiella endosymbiont of Amblyomma sculptum]QHG92426.1 preprotein translocase subunit SecE [Coxiella endosymbiont of Amblyomma sculptum]
MWGCKSCVDVLRWISVVLLIAIGAIADYHYCCAVAAVRISVGAVLLSSVLAIGSRTQKGREVWSFVKNARTELRKVIWPTRQETVRITLVVVISVSITALLLWGLDNLFMWIVAWVTELKN